MKTNLASRLRALEAARRQRAAGSQPTGQQAISPEEARQIYEDFNAAGLIQSSESGELELLDLTEDEVQQIYLAALDDQGFDLEVILQSLRDSRRNNRNAS